MSADTLDRVPTDIRLFGFPVYYDWRADRNVVELRNQNGYCIRIEIRPEQAAESKLAAQAVAGKDKDDTRRT